MTSGKTAFRSLQILKFSGGVPPTRPHYMARAFGTRHNTPRYKKPSYGPVWCACGVVWLNSIGVVLF